MSATLQEACYENTTAVYMALELSNKQWKVLIGDGHHHRHKTVVAGDIAGLLEQIALFRAKWCVPSEAPVYSCYEAGRDGFWLHRCLLSHGVKNVVVDSSSRYCQVNKIETAQPIDGYIPLLSGHNLGARHRVPGELRVCIMKPAVFQSCNPGNSV